MGYAEEDYLMLSGIQHFAFCRRQWALIHIEQQWAENYRTTAGEIFHQKAHEEELVEKRGNTLIVRGLRVASADLGVNGQCDVVEFHQAAAGIAIQGYEGTWTVLPIEYKRGRPKDGNEDAVQLCAQAMCLEEMLLTQIEKGYLFYGETKRRSEVLFTEELREQVQKICGEMHQLFSRGYTPKGKVSKKCRSCSLEEQCVTKLQKVSDVSAYIRNSIGEGEALSRNY